MSSANSLGHRVPVAGREVRLQALVRPTCRVFQPRLWTAELVEPRERGVEVCLVEEFGATNQIAFDGHELDDPPLRVEALLRGSSNDLGEHRSEIIEPMHSLDVGAEVLLDIPKDTEVSGHVARRESDPAPVVDVYTIRCRRWQLAPGERCAGPCDDGPCLRVCGRFAREVPGVEFLESGIDVVGVERDACDDPLVGVDVDDCKHLGGERLGPLVSDLEAVTTEGEALPAGRNDCRRYIRDPYVGDSPHVCDHGVPTVSKAGVHHSSTIVVGSVLGQCLGHRVPVAGREVTLEAARLLGLPRSPTAAPDD